MRLHAFAVGVASTVLLFAVNIKSSEQSAPPPSKKSASAAAPRSAPPARAAALRTAASVSSRPPTAAAFAAVTKDLFADTCSECHNSKDLSGGLDVSLYGSVDSLAADRDRWELILTKLKSREMPPDDATIAPSEEQIGGLVKFLESEFARADASMKPDPGRVSARRLNRAEYTNTIRDLLAIEFRADKNFPTDDSGEGFDNIADVLTVSPILMEKYLTAAGRIAQRAMAAVPLPKPVEVEYSLRFKNLRRLDPSYVEATHRFDFDADYELKLGLPGQRPADAAPVTLGLWVDGKLAYSTKVETKPSGLVYFYLVLRGADPRARARGRSHASPRVRRRSLRQDAREGQHLQRQREQVDRFGDGHRAVRNEGRETEPQARPGLRSVVIGSPMRGPDPRDAGASRVPQAGARIGSRRSEAIRHIGAG